MLNPNKRNIEGYEAPPSKAYAVSPNDTVVVGDSDDWEPRALYIGTGGDLTVIMARDTAPVLLKNVPSGSLLPMRVSIVKVTGTTAADIVALA